MDAAFKVVLILLVMAGIWLLVELALTARKARPVLDTVQKAAEEARPVVAQVAEVVELARPGVSQLDPVLVQTTQAIGALTGDLERLEGILDDVSRISRSAGNATVAVGDVAGTLASKARVLFAKGRTSAPAVPAAGETTASEPSEPESPAVAATEQVAPAQADGSEPAPAPVVEQEAGYFTYPVSKS